MLIQYFWINSLNLINMENPLAILFTAYSWDIFINIKLNSFLSFYIYLYRNIFYYLLSLSDKLNLRYAQYIYQMAFWTVGTRNRVLASGTHTICGLRLAKGRELFSDGESIRAFMYLIFSPMELTDIFFWGVSYFWFYWIFHKFILLMIQVILVFPAAHALITAEK